MAAALLMPGNDKLNIRIVKLVEQRQNHTAQIAEHDFDIMLNQHINDNFRSGLINRFVVILLSHYKFLLNRSLDCTPRHPARTD